MPPVSAEQLGQKLRSAREAAAISTRAAARELSLRGIPVSHATLANYERGITMPALPTVELLSNLYECPLAQLVGDSPVLAGVRYRALKSVLVRDRRHFEGEATRWIYTYCELENILDRPLRLPCPESNASLSGQHLAERVRQEFEYGDKPIPSVVSLMEKCGIRVVEVWSDARIDGMVARYGDLPVAALNPNVSNDRYRFNAAHELGHRLFGDWQSEAETPHDGDGRAHEFASHLLLPESALKRAFDGFSMVRLVRYKELFGISLAAMVVRGRKAGFITQRQYEGLFREFSRLGWRKREPGFVAPDYSSRLEQLIDSAVTDKGMSYRDVARLAGTDEREVRRRVLEAIGGQQPEAPPEPIAFRFGGKGDSAGSI